MLKSLLAVTLTTALFVSISYAKDKKQTNTQQQKTSIQTSNKGSDSGNGLVVYKVDGDPGDVMIALKGNLEAAQIIVVTTTDPVAPLANNIKLFPDYKKLKVDYMQNFLVTSMATLYKIVTNDPNAIALLSLIHI